jgi:diamine N-acetyltransferase
MRDADTPAWQIVAAGPADAAALSLIGAATFLDSFAAVVPREAMIAHCRQEHAPERYRALLEGGANAWIAGVEPGGAPIGYALTVRSDLPDARPGDIELKRIYCLPRWHGYGLGAELLERVVAQEKGHGRLLLAVYMHNPRAIAFYRKHDFHRIAERSIAFGGTAFEFAILARQLAS